MMKKLCILVLAVIFFGADTPSFAFSKKDYREVTKITKEMRKLSDKGKTAALGDYFSEKYKSFDGYGKLEILKIYAAAHRLYPNSKTREKITKFEETDDTLKIYIDETSKAKILVDGASALYASKDKIKGELKSASSYAIFYKKENGAWKVTGDEIYKETTEIRYGEAIKADFEMETPENIAPGEQYTVKTTLAVPKDRLVVGSIGHDKIIYPPEKLFDPYRAIHKNGILERIMTANKEGINEYANSTFAFISTKNESEGSKESNSAAVSGMGICVKRVNILKNQPL